jgi:hypothetical protein
MQTWLEAEFVGICIVGGSSSNSMKLELQDGEGLVVDF